MAAPSNLVSREGLLKESVHLAPSLAALRVKARDLVETHRPSTDSWSLALLFSFSQLQPHLPPGCPSHGCTSTSRPLLSQFLCLEDSSLEVSMAPSGVKSNQSPTKATCVLIHITCEYVRLWQKGLQLADRIEVVLLAELCPL